MAQTELQAGIAAKSLGQKNQDLNTIIHTSKKDSKKSGPKEDNEEGMYL